MNSYQIYNLIRLVILLISIFGVVFIVMWFRKKESDKKMQILLKTIEKGTDIGTQFDEKDKIRMKERILLLALLIVGLCFCIFAFLAIAAVICFAIADESYSGDGLIVCIVSLAIGSSFLVGYFVGRKILLHELEDEKGGEE